MQRSVISSEEAQRLIEIARAAGGGSDWALLHVLLALIAHLGRESDSMRCAVALQLIRLAMKLDPDCECVSWN
jgi:hypothetical protein